MTRRWDEILEERAVSCRGRQVPRGVKRKIRVPQPATRLEFNAAIQLAK
jgi:hypothetical protein